METNRANWDARVPIHVRSGEYDLDAFAAGKENLFEYEPAELGDVPGKRLLHLQCHLGLDTLSWARRGALVTGLDFSRPALDVAAGLAARIGVVDSARFILSDVYEADKALAGETFDVVYSNIGSLQYLPDIDRWAQIVASLLAVGGVCYINEGHPLVQLIGDDGRTLRGDYLSGAAVLLDEGTYADPRAPLAASRSVEWIHQIPQVVTALGTAGLRVEFVHERDWFWYPLLPVLVQGEDGRWRFPDGAPNMPMIYSLRAVKDQ
ncbi:MAG: class I SAM-dependent methyltransferase [Actinocrinis sp.]